MEIRSSGYSYLLSDITYTRVIPNLIYSNFIDCFVNSIGKTTTTTTPSLPGESSTPSTTPSTSTPTGTGGGSGATVYQTTGKVIQAQGTGAKTRHYASGKPDDTTQEWNIENCPFESYEMTIGVNIGKPDHDDTVSLKMLGPHTDGMANSQVGRSQKTVRVRLRNLHLPQLFPVHT